MREIKFRAKPNKAYFFESDNVPTTDGFVFGTPDTRMLNVPGAEKWRKGHEMVDQPSIVAMTRDGWPTSVAVQEETIGEFSGLQDKTGRDIYEGDIVECVSWNEYFTNPATGEVMQPFRRKMYIDFRKGGFKMVEPMPEPMRDNEWDIICNGDIEVIGNIYDNPELIHDKKL